MILAPRYVRSHKTVASMRTPVHGYIRMHTYICAHNINTETMYMRSVPVTRLVPGVGRPPQQIRHLSLHRRNVYGSRVSGQQQIRYCAESREIRYR